MRLELGKEYPDPEEPDLTDRMVRLIVERMETRGTGSMLRGQHAKTTGCVRATFTICKDVREDLRFGVFRELGKSYSAIVRFSNSQEEVEPDGVGTARGIAIKLLDVDGAKAFPDNDQRSQDFLMIDHPVFPFPKPAEYVKFFDLRGAPIIGDPLAKIWLGLFHPGDADIVRKIRAKSIASPLEVRYWSGSPYWLGTAIGDKGHAVKYLLTPRSNSPQPPDGPEDMPENYLSEALARHLGARQAIFDVSLQVQTDPIAMPVEDVSIQWDETVSVPVAVATLTIDVQNVDGAEGKALLQQSEGMRFSPWNALAEHRPMGGINRLRKAVYLASQHARRAS